MPAFHDYKIAAGWNNAGGLVNIGTIIPPGNIRFFEPVARGNWNPGLRRVGLDGHVSTAGFRSQIWLIQSMTYAQYDYLLSTFCAGGFSGNVTVRTRFRTTGYANYNAILEVPAADELDDTGRNYFSVRLLLKRLVAI